MICGALYKTALILNIETLQMIKSIFINTDVSIDNFDQLSYPLLSTHMIPDTDNCFMLEFDES